MALPHGAWQASERAPTGRFVPLNSRVWAEMAFPDALR